jgi:ABC-type multidrug transport system ATPase subunit
MPPDIIKVHHLTKSFGELKAVDGLSFTVPAGEVYGFLGQNGAGKSTTIRMLLTLIGPDEGKIEVFGMDLKKHRKEILRETGAVIEKPDLYKYLTALENLRIFSNLSGVRLTQSKLMDQLEMVGLAERAHSKVKTFSQGMKQRLGIATALVHDPRLIILDEPTNGLDPQGIADIRNLVSYLSKERGKTLLISSHLLSEMELIADSLLIIHKGKKIAEGSKKALLNPEKTLVEIVATDKELAVTKILQTKWSSYLRSSNQEDEYIFLEVSENEIPGLHRDLVENNIDIISVRPKHSLEDLFLSLTAH